MQYILMRHENEDRFDHIYDQIEKIGKLRKNSLDYKQIVERMASVLVDPREHYVHDEVIEFARLRDEQRLANEKKALEEGVEMAPVRPNRLLVAATRIKQLSTGYTGITIAYNQSLRTEVTARAISRVTGGILEEGKLYEGDDVRRWMQNHKEEEGLAVIVTHQPTIAAVLGKNAQNCDAFLVGEASGRYRAIEIINLEGRI